MATLEVKITGAKELLEKLERLGSGLSDLHNEMMLIGELLTHFYSSDGFASRGSAYGKPWAPLAASTRAYKEIFWAGRPDLVRTGDLMKGFEYAAGPMQVIIENKVEVNGYNLATIMQKGYAPHNLPPRAVMGLNEELRLKITDIINGGIRRRMEVAA